MTNYVFHTAASGERWDTIAEKYYGNRYNFAPIIMSNPQIPVMPYIEEGTEVKVPMPENVSNEQKISKLPIWKQG